MRLRIGALVEVLSNRSKQILTDMKKYHNNFSEALEVLDNPQKSRKGRSGKGKQNKNGFTDVWVNSTVTNQFVLAKISGYPPRPARVCVAKESTVETTLKNSGLCLVSFVGETHLHVVKCDEDLQPFTKEAVDSIDFSKCDSDMMKEVLQVSYQKMHHFVASSKVLCGLSYVCSA